MFTSGDRRAPECPTDATDFAFLQGYEISTSETLHDASNDPWVVCFSYQTSSRTASSVRLRFLFYFSAKSTRPQEKRHAHSEIWVVNDRKCCKHGSICEFSCGRFFFQSRVRAAERITILLFRGCINSVLKSKNQLLTR